MTAHSPPTQSEFAGLDTELVPPQRCSTSFFTLLSGVATDAAMLNSGDLSDSGEGRGGTLRLWSNRPGQNAVEALTLALLSFWLTTGIAVDLIARLLEQRWWSWPIALSMAPLIAFVALHLFTLIIALLETGLRYTGIFRKNATDSPTSFLSIAAMTTISAVALKADQWILTTAAGPWILWVTLNFFAWAILLTRNLYRSLSQLS